MSKSKAPVGGGSGGRSKRKVEVIELDSDVEEIVDSSDNDVVVASGGARKSRPLAPPARSNGNGKGKAKAEVAPVKGKGALGCSVAGELGLAADLGRSLHRTMQDAPSTLGPTLSSGPTCMRPGPSYVPVLVQAISVQLSIRP
jgi:hypothetical protein